MATAKQQAWNRRGMLRPDGIKITRKGMKKSENERRAESVQALHDMQASRPLRPPGK